MRMYEGSIVDAVRLRTIQGSDVQVPATHAPLTHLQFRRFAGCPICNLHLRTLVTRRDEIASAGIHEVIVFHSEAETMRPFQGDLPFDVVADPNRELYRRFGVGTSLWSVADPRAWVAYARGVLARHPASSRQGEGGHLGLPADFLLTQEGRIAACKYGAHAADQWAANELLELARTRGAPTAPAQNDPCPEQETA
jgi:peroxiredoxin